MPEVRDHLFISYATEDAVFARWLALRLTALGYRVWIDQFELLGGERYPAEIDTAIKSRTFRFIALLSRSSLSKPNPTKERTLALNLAREREEDFVIPLNLDGLRPTELDWMSSDLTFIPFDREWATGLDQLVRQLERQEAPRLEGNIGPRAAATAIQPDTAVVEEAEVLNANLFRVLNWPEVLHQYRFARPVGKADLLAAADAWAFHYLPGGPGQRLLAFAFEDTPEGCFGDTPVYRDASALWQSMEDFKGIPTWNLVKPITVRALYLKARQLGLHERDDGSFVYFPRGLLPKDRLQFTSYSGRTVPLRVVGERAFRGTERFRYHLGLFLDLLHLPGGVPCAKMAVRLRLTDLNGNDLPTVSALARRKSVTRTWFNHQFHSRLLALASFLADEDGKIRCGRQEKVVLDARPLAVEADRRIDETLLPKGRNPFARPSDQGSEEDGE